MCGACGSGRVRAPWEDTVGPPDRAAPRRFAAALTRALGPWRWRVAPWAGGYTVSGPQGALPPAHSVDEIVARARAARPGTPLVDTAPADGLALADAVVRVAVTAAQRGGPVLLCGPDPGQSRRLTTRDGVAIDVVPRAGTAWAVG
ncbi:hypothetical protein [Actinomycetospora straminea]|uniref:Uncharacterized protein n=1 Tax=Actinomycetospora straminea TaxID=663607 RepID=A0ABP9DTX2_9PSEU|nr:hypothetical protein [Actinomycetospora straminea]MDD7932542.1 hypothetical protein [Actinomycetospora straminea]